MKITGGCHCGAITYEAEIDPDTVVLPKTQIWCRSALGWTMHLEPVAQIQKQ